MTSPLRDYVRGIRTSPVRGMTTNIPHKGHQGMRTYPVRDIGACFLRVIICNKVQFSLIGWEPTHIGSSKKEMKVQMEEEVEESF